MNQEKFFENFMLGVTSGHIPVEDRASNFAAVHKFTCSATLSLNIMSRSLDHTIYDRADIVEAFSNFIRRSRNSTVRILIYDSTNIIKDGHRLFTLAGKVPSKIVIRQLPDDFKDFNESMVIADRTGFLHNQQSDRYEGIVSFNDHQRCAELNKTFTDFWDRSLMDSNLRQIVI